MMTRLWGAALLAAWVAASTLMCASVLGAADTVPGSRAWWTQAWYSTLAAVAMCTLAYRPEWARR